MGKNKMTYTPDPSMADEPLAIDEIVDLRADGGKALTTGRRNLAHFLQRVEATARTHLSQIEALHRQVAAINMRMQAGAGRPTTLDVTDAFRYARPEDLKPYFDSHMRQQLEIIERRRAETEVALARVQAQQATMQLLARQLRTIPGLTPEAAARITELLAPLAAQPATAPPAPPAGQPSAEAEPNGLAGLFG